MLKDVNKQQAGCEIFERSKFVCDVITEFRSVIQKRTRQELMPRAWMMITFYLCKREC